jgi:hypothetical protein
MSLLRRLLALSLTSLLAAHAGMANADDSPPQESPQQDARGSRGVRVGVRAAYGQAYGEAASGSNINRNSAGSIPIGIDVGYRLSERFYLGAYGSFGPAFRHACPDGASCSGSLLRIGAASELRFTTHASWTPWLGAGLGLEQFRHGVEADAAESHVTYTGFELLLSGGVDFPLDRIALGPFLGASVGTYPHTSSSSTIAGQTDESSGATKTASIHGWALMGVRAAFTF